MLDRIISGAGAWTDLADRPMRLLLPFRARPGSLVVAGALGIATALLLYAGIEATGNPEPRALGPAEIASTADFGLRTYATVDGAFASAYTETYTDKNENGVQDPDETGRSWFYWVVDPATQTGVTIRSTVPPDTVFAQTYTGVLTRDPAYVAPDREQFADWDAARAATIDDTYYVDAINAGSGTPTQLQIGDPYTNGTRVTVSGPLIGDGGYLRACSTDPNGDGVCGEGEADMFDVAVYDPQTRKAIVVAIPQPPSFHGTFTGMLRRDAGAVSDAATAEGLDFSALGITVNPTYVLDDGARPASAPAAFGLALLCALVAIVLVVGWAGRYLVFRGGDMLPSAARTMVPGERLPLRVTGSLIDAAGLLHVREARATLTRIALPIPSAPSPPETSAPPAPPAATPEPSAWVGAQPAPGEAPPLEAPAPTEPPAPPAAPPLEPPAAVEPPTAPPTALIIERDGGGAGIAIERGRLVQVTAGRVLPFRGPRPALRADAGTGRLLLSFDSVELRNRAAAELLEEGGPEARGPMSPGSG